MKKTVIISLTVLMTAFAAKMQAQTSFIISPEVGIHTSRSNVTGDLDISQDFQGMDVNTRSIFSYQGGIGLGIQFAGSWAILTGVRYNRKGGRTTVETRNPNNPFQITFDPENVTFDVGEFTVTTEHNWLSIPILARAQFGGKIKGGLAIGPQINMALGKIKEVTEYNFENTNLSSEEDTYSFGSSTSDPLKKSHISLLVLPYISYDMSEKSSLRFSMMIESGGNMVNDNAVVLGNNGLRNINATMRNTQVGIMLSYEYRLNFKTGTKY